MQANESHKRFVLIDGKSVFYRGYYAMPYLSNKDGISTGGVYGFAVMALEVIRLLKPDYVAVAWDKPKTNIRKRLEMYPEYKAGRKPAPPDFYEQIPILHELLDAFGWPLYELDDYEADDIMGTLARQAHEREIETLLVTSDLDALQLIGPLTKVYILKKGLSSIELYSPKSFEAKYGIAVSQFLDLKALKGDASDNIPGVPGIGEKTAIELLRQYKNIDEIYANLDLLKQSTRAKLESGKDLAYLSKKLGAIWTDAPIVLDLNEVNGSKVNPERIREILNKLEFRTLVQKLPEAMHALPDQDLGAKNNHIASSQKIVHINNDDSIKKCTLNNTSSITVYLFKNVDSKMLLLSPIDQNVVYILDLKQLSETNVVACIKNVHKIIGYDTKSILREFLEFGTDELPEVVHDVLDAAFILNSLRREQTFTGIASMDLGYAGVPFETMSAQQCITYARDIVTIIQALYDKQKDEMSQIPKLSSLAANIEWPVIPVLASMEHTGMKLDTKYLNDYAIEINHSIADLEKQIYDFVGREFNISSPIQLAEVLFSDLELSTKGIKKGKSGYSTAASELAKLQGAHPVIDLITQYREVVKLKNTYIDTLPKLVDSRQRLHTTFNLATAQTGRLSSTDPNLQNIPVRTELGRRIRTAFVASKNKILVSADYSQFELRLAAAMAHDEEMIEMFNNGVDIHTATAALVYGREQGDVTKNMRRAAKAINFGILYGMSPHGLSIAAEMTREQATDFIERYKELRKPLFEYMDKIKEFARKEGYVETLFGRRRPMPDIHSSNFIIRQAAERAAINMPIQGTEADLMKMAMVAVHGKLRSNFKDANMLLQIHDSILVECSIKDAEAVGLLLKENMENIYTDLPVKLMVDVSTGINWGDL